MLIISVISLAILLLLGVPIYIGLSGSTFISLITATSISPEIFVQRMLGGIDKFGLMAIPFFVFAANIMATGGMARKILNIARSLVGGFKPGLAFTSIVSCMFFGAMSGSSPATVVAIGSLMFPALREANYSEKFSSGVVTSSAAIALVIPPSISMIVYAASTGVSVGALFMAGLGAGCVIGLLFMLYSVFYTSRNEVTSSDRFNFKDFLITIKEGIWALGVPVIIVGGIYGGVFTPTEAAAVSAAYAMLVSLFIYREFNFKQLYRCAIDSAETTAMIMVMVAGAMALSWIWTIGGIPNYISQNILAYTNSKIAILVIMNIIMLIAGMFIDGSAFILILAPIFLPIATRIGIDPIHLGIIMVVNGAIGMFTPPFGLNLFVATSVTKLSYSKVVKGIWPFIAISIISLIVITYLPSISMWLPNLLYSR